MRNSAKALIWMSRTVLAMVSPRNTLLMDGTFIVCLPRIADQPVVFHFASTVRPNGLIERLGYFLIGRSRLSKFGWVA